MLTLRSKSRVLIGSFFMVGQVVLGIVVRADSLDIVNLPWPIIERTEPTNLTGQHPVIGKLACPSLLRTNPKLGGSEPVLLASLPEVNTASGKSTWSFTPRPDVKFWSGAAADGDFLKTFISDLIKRAHRAQIGDVWTLPAFKTTVEGTKVVVDWENAPEFGPGLLANWPVFRKAAKGAGQELEYECTGKFLLTVASDQEAKLQSKVGADIVRIVSTQNFKTSKTKSIQFKTANSYGGSPWTRMSDEPVKCTHRLDLTVFVIISWNGLLWPTDSEKFREVLTSLTPRGELLRAGAGHLGDLLSAPILRRHPGYNKSALVRPFDIDSAIRDLDQMGFHRPSPEKTRRDAKGRELAIKIQVPEKSTGLVDKVVIDSFHSVGIKVERETGNIEPAKLNGKIIGLFAASNEFDWLPMIHSNAKTNVLLSLPKDEKLDKLLEGYSKSLTMMKPNYQYLRDIHRLLFEIEPFTVLINNRACVEANFSINAVQLEEAFVNPDWLTSISGI